MAQHGSLLQSRFLRTKPPPRSAKSTLQFSVSYDRAFGRRRLAAAFDAPSAKPALSTPHGKRRQAAALQKADSECFSFCETDRLGGLISVPADSDELLAAFRAEIETQLLIDVVADLVACGVFQAFENVLDLFE